MDLSVQHVLKTISASELMNQTFPEIDYIVPGILPRGFSLLAGRPKVGKSFLALNLGIAVATGSDFFNVPVASGSVLFLGLEDNLRRLQDRTKIMLGVDCAPKELYFATECPVLDAGGLHAISEWCSRVDRPTLIVIDVFARIRQQAKTGRMYDEDYKAGTPLKALADSHNLAVVAVTHTRKEVAIVDQFDAISATTGLAAVADSVLLLDRDSKGPRLYGRGRDLPEFESSLRMDGATGCWELLGDPQIVNQSEARKQIHRVLREAVEPLTPKEIATRANGSHASTRHLLGAMVKSGEIEKVGVGRYCQPSHSQTV